jgi:hypothetical protein
MKILNYLFILLICSACVFGQNSSENTTINGENSSDATDDSGSEGSGTSYNDAFYSCIIEVDDTTSCTEYIGDSFKDLEDDSELLLELQNDCSSPTGTAQFNSFGCLINPIGTCIYKKDELGEYKEHYYGSFLGSSCDAIKAACILESSNNWESTNCP